jgi:hypothetical protein
MDYKLYHTRTVAAIVAISIEAGPELIMCFEKSVNSPKFIKYLSALRKKYPTRKLAIFMD